jgi:glycosyltransferase involved in cell wall biosynthesis
VTLFASGDSVTKAKLSSYFPHAIGNSGLMKSDAIEPLLQYDACYKRAKEFDIIHSHGQYYSLFGARNLGTPVILTWHGSFYAGEVPEEKRDTLRAFSGIPIVSISNNQRLALPDLTYAGTVYNSLDIAEYTFVERPTGDYLLWVGRMSPKKGAMEAIMISKKLGIRLEMAAALDPIDRPYFDKEIKPHIDGVNIVFHGELSHNTLITLYGNAKVVLYPISWHEPFGLVMIESMACGTPVVAYNVGSVPEVVEDGVTGFVIAPSAGIDALIHAVKRIDMIDRHACRKHVEKRFHKDRMVKDYESVYKKVISGTR